MNEHPVSAIEMTFEAYSLIYSIKKIQTYYFLGLWPQIPLKVTEELPVGWREEEEQEVLQKQKRCGGKGVRAGSTPRKGNTIKQTFTGRNQSSSQTFNKLARGASSED